ncbi:cingulin isoform X1 [Oryzias melastigma]|uniref:cingulin isoform X1 n=1 Tax=Oryzias melastigma TaxID=30732 RepID=UPI000CF7EEB0|nr:cingulin isoform X1 [Oryzias melastigma]XP_024123275.1 cingulin isoform X1 [Oryzias melastigma]
MSTQSSGHKTAVDHGVQIRFINNIGDGGRQPAPQLRNKPPSSSKYGVAVRVQGIAGQPYVVLKDGQKGDSYGVQLRTDYGPDYRSLPRRKVKPELGMEEAYGETGAGGGQGGALRRAQSHGSLLDRDGEAANEDFELSRPPGDGKSGSYGNLDGGIGVRGNNGETWASSGREGAVERRMWGGSYQAANLSRSQESLRDNQLNPYPPQNVNEFHLHQRQSAFSKLKNRFDGGAPASQQSGPPPATQHPRATSPYINQSPYTSPPSSTHSSLGRSQGPLVASRSSSQWSSEERLQVDPPDTRATPDLLLDQVQSAEMSSEEEQLMKSLYSILRQGSNERDAVIRQKVETIFQKLQSLKPKESPQEEWMRAKRELETKVVELQTALREERRESARNSDPALKAELESCLDENLQLQELLDRKNKDLNETQSEVTQLRMDRESAEKHIRDMEDQLAELQEEMRRENGSKTQDLMSCQTQLMEVCQLKQKLEDALRQRERELTALKGALKDEVASHDREIEALREQYSADMEKFHSSMEQVSQSQAGIEAERLRVNASVRSLQKQLEDCRDESSHWMEQFHATRDELRSAKQELLQTRLEKDELEDEVKELKDKMSSMKQQTPDPKHTEILSQELQRSSGDLQKVKSELEKQRVDFDKKVMEVITLKKSHQNQEAELRYEIDRLKEQLQRAKEDFAKAQEKNKQLPNPATVSDLEQKLGEAQREVSRLKEKLSEAEEELETTKSHLNRAQADVDSLRETQSDQEAANSRLKEKLSRLEAQLQSSAAESSEAELTLHTEMRSLRSELDEAKRRISRLNQEHQEVTQRLESSERDKETLKQTISQLEDAKSQLGRAMDKLNKDYEALKVSSKDEVQALSSQLEEQRERARKEMQDAQRHGKDAQSELEKHHVNLRRMEEEMLRQKKEFQLACEERDNHQLDKELLSNRLRHLEGELEASKNSHSEKAREIRILEDKLKCMELECEEEKSTVEMLTERVSRSRDQIDQLRSELMQERSSKQDLELDKNAMERQLKELRSRVAEMEGQSRSSTGVSQLENKILELEDRLRNEEREKNSVLASQRRSERKLKELNMTLDEERHTHTEQRDQLTLKVKALKRQVDESETELERIEGLRRKAQRDMEEQVELKESLQARVKALETELKRKTQAAMRQALESSALSSDDDDSLYDHSTITSILTESNLQTSSC